MKFGKVEDANGIDFSLPQDHRDTKSVFKREQQKSLPKIYVGCSKWGKKDLANFYPKGTKDELTYYSSQFNSIEFNAPFYRIFSPEQFEKWKNKTPEGFKFFPKLAQEISHFKQLNGVEEVVDRYLHSVIRLEEKLGTMFLQMNERFAPNRFDKLVAFIELWPKELPLTVELRNTEWYNDINVAQELYHLLESNGISNTLVDTAGRRDLIHMRMTTPKPFIRYVGANHASDYTRLDDWIARIKQWTEQGMQELNFFIHQNVNEETPLIASHFIELLNVELGYEMHVPKNLIK